MAYPFPRFASAPLTPQHLRGIESPRNSIRHPRPSGFLTRVTVLLGLFILLMIWIINPFSTPTRRNDRIPLSHDLIDELVLESSGTSPLLTAFFQLL